MASAGRIGVSQAVFTPAAGAHGALDVIGAAAEFKGLRTGIGSGVQIISASLMVADSAALTTDWRVHFFSVTPPTPMADNDLFDVVAANRASYLGFLTITQITDVGTTLFGQSDNINKAIFGSGYGVFAHLQAVSGITTANVAHTVTLFTMS